MRIKLCFPFPYTRSITLMALMSMVGSMVDAIQENPNISPLFVLKTFTEGHTFNNDFTRTIKHTLIQSFKQFCLFL